MHIESATKALRDNVQMQFALCGNDCLVKFGIGDELKRWIFSMQGGDKFHHRQIIRVRAFHPDEYLPGPTVGDDAVALAKAAGDIGTTIFHPVGTAKMGLPSDPLAVLDARLRVMGLERLRVIDASVMPTITSGNTNTPTIMIADRGAAMVLEDG